MPRKGARGRGLQAIDEKPITNGFDFDLAPPEETVEERREAPLAGVGGVHRYKLEIISEGSNEIRFEYRRPWLDETDQFTTLSLDTVNS